MKKLVLLFLVWPSLANAAACQIPPFYDGFSGQFFNTTIVSGFVYGLDEKYMYVPLVNTQTAAFINVPQSTAQNFNYSKTPDSYYTSQIYGRYHRPFLTETCSNILVAPGIFLLIS